MHWLEKIRNPGWLYNSFEYQTIAKKLPADFTSSFEENMTISKEQKRKHSLPLPETYHPDIKSRTV